MKSTTRAFAVLLPLLLVGGCIVGDELTTLTIHPDGSADLVVLRSNLRSTEQGSQAERELADYRRSFESRTDDTLVRIREAKGTIVEASWIREQVPFANYVRARFPNAAALESYGSSKDETEGVQVTTQFGREGVHRRLTVRITVPPGQESSFQASSSDDGQLRQAYADGISETRIAVANGSITAARGFTVAGDKQSALLSLGEIGEMIRLGHGKAELSLEWDVTQ